MADSRSEIEARKQRIAESRRQRDAHIAAPTPTKASSTSVVPPAAHLDIPEPFSYTRQTQTSPIEVASNDKDRADPESNGSSNSTSVGSSDVATSTHPEDASNTDLDADSDKPETEEVSDEFRLASTDHMSPQLSTFIDDTWRAVKRMSVKDYRSTPNKLVSEDRKSGCLTLLSETHGIGRSLAFSPFHALVAAADPTNPRRVIVAELCKDRSVPDEVSSETDETDVEKSAEKLKDKPKNNFRRTVEHQVDVEFSLRSPTPVCGNLVFSPLAAQLVFGAGHNGQILVWDLKNMSRTGGRYELSPQMRSPIASSAVVASSPLGNTSLVTVNVDGILEVWAADRSSRPLHTLSLEDSFRVVMAGLRISVLVPTASSIHIPPDYGSALGFGWKVGVVGTLSGHSSRLPNTATGLAYNSVDSDRWQHAASVTCLQLAHRSVRPADLHSSIRGIDDRTDYIRSLSGGLDWHIRSWLVPLDEHSPPRLEQSFRIDYAVTSVVWHPTNALVFAAGGDTTVEIYRLDRSRPLTSISVAHPVKQLSFRDNTSAVATSESVSLYQVENETTNT